MEATPEILAATDLEEAGEVPAEAGRRGMFRRLRERLSRTREALSGGLDRMFRGRKVVDAELLDRPAIHFRYKADLDGNPLNPPTADNQTATEWPRLRPRTRGNGSGGKSPRTK